MPSRASLELRAQNVGIDPDSYPNDSTLEQKTLYEEKQAGAATGVKATGTYTASSVANGNTVTIGSKTYTFKTTLSGVRATGTLTSDATAPSDGDTVTIGNKTYTFKTALSAGPTVANEVLIGVSAAVSLDNLKSAINGTAGEGSTYSTGTVAHTQVRATTNTDTTQVIEALAIGTAGNSIATTENGTHTSFGAATLTGGAASVANEVLIGGSDAVALDNLKLAVNGTAVTEFAEEYSTGTVAHTQVTATTNGATTQVFEAISAGDAGNNIATTEVSAGSFAATTLTGGSDATDVDSSVVYSAIAAQESGEANI